MAVKEWTLYEKYIHKSRYARYVPELKRRETWEETVQRYCAYWQEKLPAMSSRTTTKIKTSITSRDVMPSMRCLMAAGSALDRDNCAGYNCAYTPIDHPRCFDEILYILMCGTGVGFSVEESNVLQLPTVQHNKTECNEESIIFADSKIGWADGYRKLIQHLYEGNNPVLDFSRIRPAGTPLKTFGGRASGPAPLRDLCTFTSETFSTARGRKLTSLEVHDLVCKIADAVVCGGVRRSALISLSDVSSTELATAKTGEWWSKSPWRKNANNSACYTNKPDLLTFIREWSALVESRSGERGIFSRRACSVSIPTRRDANYEWGTNPCSEIILRPRQFCNLTEVIIRHDDTLENLRDKVRTATILGTIQSTLSDFRYLRAEWRHNTEDERLLGVSLTGIMDHPTLNHVNPTAIEWLKELKDVAIKTNTNWSKRLGINASTAITCVKPSGTVSQLCNSASGIHPRYASHYIRRVRADENDPLCGVMATRGLTSVPDNLQHSHRVFSFPIKSPKQTKRVADIGAIEQLEHWMMFDEHWCEHKPSVSIYVKEDEWLEVGAFVYRNFDKINGVSFFPVENHTYAQAPYEEITKEEYNTMMKDFPKSIDLDFEEDIDNTTSSQELACSGGQCEL